MEHLHVEIGLLCPNLHLIIIIIIIMCMLIMQVIVHGARFQSSFILSMLKPCGS